MYIYLGSDEYPAFFISGIRPDIRKKNSILLFSRIFGKNICLISGQIVSGATLYILTMPYLSFTYFFVLQGRKSGEALPSEDGRSALRYRGRTVRESRGSNQSLSEQPTLQQGSVEQILSATD